MTNGDYGTLVVVKKSLEDMCRRHDTQELQRVTKAVTLVYDDVESYLNEIGELPRLGTRLCNILYHANSELFDILLSAKPGTLERKNLHCIYQNLSHLTNKLFYE